MAIGAATVLPPIVALWFGEGGGPPVPLVGLVAIVGTLLAVGLLTPVAGMAMTVLAVAAASGVADLPPDTPVTSWLVVAMALALVLLGPGAYSVDARLFGRREVVVSHPPRR